MGWFITVSKVDCQGICTLSSTLWRNYYTTTTSAYATKNWDDRIFLKNMYTVWQFCYAFIVIFREPYVLGQYFKHIC